MKKNICLHCKCEFEGRPHAKFCSHSHRASYHTEIRRLSKKKEKHQKMIEKLSTSPNIDEDIMKLYARIFGA